MKVLKSISVAVLCLSLIAAFTFRPVNKSKRMASSYFQLVTSNEFTPGDYVTYTGVAPILESTCPCPLEEVCVVYTDDLHTSGPNIGKPRVDVSSPSNSDIRQRIIDVKANPCKNAMPGNGGDIVWLMEE